MDQKITDSIANTSSEIHGNIDLSDESYWDLPLTSIEQLELFEEKLSDKLFRKKSGKFILNFNVFLIIIEFIIHSKKY